MTNQFEKIATLSNEIEAMCLKAELAERGVPHAIQSHHDTALDGLFQASRGWGHVEAPVECTGEILEVLHAIREQSVPPDDEADQRQDNDDLA